MHMVYPLTICRVSNDILNNKDIKDKKDIRYFKDIMNDKEFLEYTFDIKVLFLNFLNV